MAELAENLKEELTCPVCLEYFSHPVTLGCGHNFCRLCLLKEWEEVDQTCSCPECRRRFHIKDFEINHRLSRLSGIARKIRPYLLQLKRESAMCERHQEEQELFCEEDQTLLCASCVQTQDHSKHTVCLIEKAAEKSRDKLQKTLDLLWEKVQFVQDVLIEEREKISTWSVQAFAWRESIRVQYERLVNFLIHEEELQRTHLNADESKNMERLKESEAKLSQYLQNLKKVIIELEQNEQKTDLQLLQGVGSSLDRSEALLRRHPETADIQSTIMQVTGIWEMMKFFRVNVTLDAESACPYLIVSEDMKTVTHGGFQHYIPTGPEQFEDGIILGAQAFDSGMCYWEVYVGDSRKWTVGVCKASLSRNVSISCIDGDVCISCLEGDVFALTHFQNRNSNTFSVITTPLSIKNEFKSPIKKIGIFLDYDKGSISIYDADKHSLIFHFPSLSFSEPMKAILCPSPSLGEERGVPMTINP